MNAASLGREALAGAKAAVFWTDRPDLGVTADVLRSREQADLVIVGAGFTGLWAALLATEQDPGRRVTVLESGTVASGASGRNGGFIAASLTHGIAHGARTWPAEMPQLQRLGHQNLDEIEAFVSANKIDADLRRCGKTTVAVKPYQVRRLQDAAVLFRRHGEEVEWLEAGEVRADVASPTYLGGLRVRSGYGLVDPAQLAWGLADVARQRGVRIYERSRVRDLRAGEGHILALTEEGGVRAAQAIVATNAFPAPLKRMRHYIVPFYDYVLMTEPLGDARWAIAGLARATGHHRWRQLLPLLPPDCGRTHPVGRL